MTSTKVADLAGPQVHEVAEMVRSFDSARGTSRRSLGIRIPGAVGRAYRAGENLADRSAVRGRATWEEFLAV